jgi:hypothetical protein
VNKDIGSGALAEHLYMLTRVKNHRKKLPIIGHEIVSSDFVNPSYDYFYDISDIISKIIGAAPSCANVPFIT